MAPSQNGTVHVNGRVAPSRQQAPPPPSAGLRAERQSNASGQAPNAKTVPTTTPSPQPEAPSNIAQLAATRKVPWGKFKGKTLAELSGSDEGCSYLYFMAYKSEPKSENDRSLQSAAIEVVKEQVAVRLQAAIAQHDAAMPFLPFGDEKGKRLHQAHPKWVAMLAKKQESDARSFADLLLYAAAHHLQAERGPSSNFRRSGGLSDEQFGQLLDELKGIRVAMEAVVSKAVNQ